MRIDSPDSIEIETKNNPAQLAPNMQLNNESKDVDELIIEDNNRNQLRKKEDIFEKVDILDLIHAVQINCECSPLDKENSHFIMCDLTIATNELMKTQELDLDDDLDLILDSNKTTKNKTLLKQPDMSSTNSIQISNKATTSFNFYSSLESSITNSYVSSTKQNSPQQLFFALDPAEAYSPIETNSNSSPVSNFFNETNLIVDNASVSSNKKDSKRSIKQKSSFNRSFSNSSGLNNIKEVDQLSEISIVSNSVSSVCYFNYLLN